MKALLEFTLPEEEIYFKDATNGAKWKYIVWQIEKHLRTELKYNDALPKEAYEHLSKTRDTLYQLLNQENLDLD